MITTDVLNLTTDNDRRGAQHSALDLNDELRRRGRRSEIVALTSGRHTEPLPIRPLGESRLGLKTLRALRREIAQARVVVGHGSTTLPAIALAGAGLRARFVYRNIGDPLYWANSPARRARTRLLFRRTDQIVALWSGSEQILRNHFGVAPERLHVIPNAVRADAFQPVAGEERAAARDKFGLPRNARVAVAIGSLSPEKRVGDAIQAIARLPEAHLVIVGDGPERSVLEEQAHRQAPGRVLFCDHSVASTTALAAADVLVLTSASEGIPGVVIQAGLRGLPVVATDVGGVAEVVADGETGYLVAPGDTEAIVGCLGRALVQSDGMGERAHSRCLERFTVERVVDEWENVLGELGAWDASRAKR